MTKSIFLFIILQIRDNEKNTMSTNYSIPNRNLTVVCIFIMILPTTDQSTLPFHAKCSEGEQFRPAQPRMASVTFQTKNP